MNLRLPVLVGSAALNAALVGLFVLRPSLAPAALRSWLPTESSPANAPKNPAASPANTPAAAKPSADGLAVSDELWAALQSEDLPTLVQRLRAAGFPATMVRAIVEGEIERRFGPRLRELQRSVTDTPYWRQGSNSPLMGSAKIYEEVNQIYRERARLLRDLLGRDALAYAGMDPSVAQRMQFGNLSQAKIDLVQRINDDYAEMTSQVSAAMQGVTLPEDREKMALLEREKRNDLAAVLTPDELAAYEMRTSQVTMRLRSALTIMDATEAEFRTIYQAYEPVKDVLYPTMISSGFIMMTSASDTSDKRTEATKQVNDQLKAALGDARYQQYQRANDNEFQQLYRLGQRDSLPYDTLVRAYDVRTAVSEASNRIANDTALTPDAKRAALKDLAQDARTKLLSTLGPGAGPVYVENSRWLPYLEQGRSFTVNPTGGVSTRTVAPPPRPTPAAATPKG